jgi:hypothetical protein
MAIKKLDRFYPQIYPYENTFLNNKFFSAAVFNNSLIRLLIDFKNSYIIENLLLALNFN